MLDLFKKGDGLPNGTDCTVEQRSEIISLLKEKGYFCLCSKVEWMPIVFNGGIWAICTNDDITNKLNYLEMKNILK
jgi:hypothetical protein